MEESFLQPSEELIKKAYDHLFNSDATLSKIRDSALGDRLLPSTSDSMQVVGRSIAWKLFLTLNEPLQSSSSMRKAAIVESLRVSRQNYVKHISQHMRAPDGSYEEGFVLLGSFTIERPSRVSKNLETNNPLSLHKENPWKEWFAVMELQKTILQDVERTFPEIGFFRDPEVHLQLSNILLLYSVMNPSIGYRQGMHEILAPLYYSVDYDSVPQDAHFGPPEMREICSRLWIAADAWALFDNVMRGLSKYYEWREPPINSISGNISSPLPSHVHLTFSHTPFEIKPYVAPIVEVCNRIQTELLRLTDPLLWKHMQATGIEPQIYGIRWLRLIFTREFSMADALKLWDSLFASDPSLELAQWVCVAMLIRIRNELISADYSTQLTILLRYPSARTISTFDGAPLHTTLLVRQALALQMSPTPSTGASLVLENRNLLNIPAEVPVSNAALRRARSPHSKAANVQEAPNEDTSVRPTTSPQPSLPETLARGWMGRGESLGLNRTLMSAVSEIRRNIPDLAASLVRSPNASHSAFPLTDERSPEVRSPWEHSKWVEKERAVSQLRSRDKRLGESLAWIVDVLLQDEAEARDPGSLKEKKQTALESLSHVRDILLGNVIDPNEDRLVEIKPWKKTKVERRDSVALTVPRPVPVPVVDSLSRVSRSSPIHPRNTFATGSHGSGTIGWNHARSSSSGFSPSLPVEGLPRLPPSSSHSRESASTKPSPGSQDPLGVLR